MTWLILSRAFVWCAAAWLRHGKRAAAVFYGRPSAALGYGQGASWADFPPVWVLPSTSGAASGAWSEQPWRSLAQAVLA